MRTLTKITTGVAATAIAFTGLLGAAGTAAATEQHVQAGITAPILGDLTLTGTVVEVKSKYVTIVLDGSHRKIVVDLTELEKAIGQLKVGVKIEVVTAGPLLDLIKAKIIIVLG